jgi:caffeoyl-CoA O-methyltransferase
LRAARCRAKALDMLIATRRSWALGLFMASAVWLGWRAPAASWPSALPVARAADPPSAPPPLVESKELDARVRAFLDRMRGQWHDWNVPPEDGQALFDLIIKERFTRGLEIGTSTGHSTVWMAWALSKTGGKLVTIEIDRPRYEKAKENVEAAGLTRYVDARLANAHDLVKALPGPFDVVFSDADKEWYTQYFKDLESKLAPRGCFTAHNVLDGFAGVGEFLDYVRSRPSFTTTILRTSKSGISLSCRAPGA